MKYVKKLRKDMIPEWIKMYLNFELLYEYLALSLGIYELLIFEKSTLPHQDYQILKKQILTNDQIKLVLSANEVSFIKKLQSDLAVVEQFLLFKYKDILKKFTKLSEQGKTMRQTDQKVNKLKYGEYRIKKNKLKNFTEYDIKRDELKESLFIFYHEVDQVIQYNASNRKSITKILGYYRRIKSKKQQTNIVGLQELLPLMDQIPDELSTIQQKIEEILILNYYPKKVDICHEILQKHTSAKQNLHIYKIGLFAGILISLILFLIILRYQGFVDPEESESVFSSLFPCFRGVILMLLYYLYLAFDVWGWNYFQINYKVYLGFNHHFSSFKEIFMRVTYLCAFTMFLFTVYVLQEEKIIYLHIPSELLPILTWVVLLGYVFFPTRTRFNPLGRRWMYRYFYDAIVLSFEKFETKYLLLMDQITSLAVPLRDLDYTICYYYVLATTGKSHHNECFSTRVSSLFIVLLPQFMNSLIILNKSRQLGEFWKTSEMWQYFKILFAMTVSVTSFICKFYPLVTYFWIPLALISSCWNFWWDMNKERMLFEEKHKKTSLRTDLGYDNPLIYFTLAVLNFILRLSWALSISPSMYQYLNLKDQQIFILFIGFLEITRRLIANFMRIEKEYILNMRSLKSITVISYPFDDNSSQELSLNSVSTLGRSQGSNVRLTKLKEQFDDHLYYYSNQAFRNLKIENELDVFRHKSVDMSILDSAKKQEKFQQTLLATMKAQNELHMGLIVQIKKSL